MSFWENYEKGIVFVALYLYDNLIVGHPETIENTIKLLEQNGFILKVEDDLKDYLSCEIHFSANKEKAWVGQPHLLASLEKNLEMMFNVLEVPKLMELQILELFTLLMMMKRFQLRTKSNTIQL